jgi:hypothetical protein
VRANLPMSVCAADDQSAGGVTTCPAITVVPMRSPYPADCFSQPSRLSRRSPKATSTPAGGVRVSGCLPVAQARQAPQLQHPHVGEMHLHAHLAAAVRS